ncbi:hypothetical protein BGC10_14875 [Brucella abortus]|nr:hypothetical protein BGC10_14875 [Brucella abortus]
MAIISIYQILLIIFCQAAKFKISSLILAPVNRRTGDFLIGTPLEPGNCRRLQEILAILIYPELRKLRPQ